MLKEILDDTQRKFNSSLEHFKSELNSIRSSHISPALVEDLLIQAYDAQYSLKELAAISVAEHSVLLIQPWDPNTIQPIESALNEAALGASPTVDNNNIRLNIPPLSQERRQELIKRVNTKTEDAKVAIRNIRQEKIKSLDLLCDDGKISEDEHKRSRKQIQTLVDEFNEKIQQLKDNKITGLQ